METNIYDYHNATKYETLVRHAYNSRAIRRNGAHQSFLLIAIRAEHNIKCVKTLKKYQKELETVKRYLSKALLKLARTAPYSSESEFFFKLEDLVCYCNDTFSLIMVIKNALDKVIIIRDSYY